MTSSISKKGAFRDDVRLSNRNLVFFRLKNYDVDEIESSPNFSLFPFIIFPISSFVAPISTLVSSLEVFPGFPKSSFSPCKRSLCVACRVQWRESSVGQIENAPFEFLRESNSSSEGHAHATLAGGEPCVRTWIKQFPIIPVSGRVRSGFDLLSECSILIELC